MGKPKNKTKVTPKHKQVNAKKENKVIKNDVKQKSNITPKTTTQHKQDTRSNGKPTSWAALFESEKPKLESQNENEKQETESKTQENIKPKQSKKTQRNASSSYLASSSTKQNSKKNEQKTFYTKGLRNISNSCFINSVLQVLMNCPLFIKILSDIKNIQNLSSFTVTSALVKIMNEMLTKSKPGTTSSIANAKHIFQLFKTKSTLMQEGHQEDAEELLSFLLHELHEEFLRIQTLNENSSIPTVNTNQNEDENDDDDEGWEEVTSKGSSVKVQKHKMQESVITKNFGGQFRSIAKSKGQKGTLNVEPFLVLPLDLDGGNVESIKQALKLFASPEVIEGQRKTQKKVMIERLPPVLILQLKRFVFTTTGGMEKVSDFVEYPVHLNLDTSIVPPHKIPKNNIQRQYQLISVVCHGGDTVEEGHYVSFIKTREGKWFGYDDEMIEEVDQDVALDQQAYLLVYLNKAFRAH